MYHRTMQSVLDSVSASLLALVTAGTALLGFLGVPGRRRSQLRHDIDMLDKLPKDSDAYRLMLTRITRQISRLEGPLHGRRNWPTFVLALVFAPGSGLLMIYLWNFGSWWSYLLAIPAGLLTVVFLYGIFESGQKVPRDGKGRRLPPVGALPAPPDTGSASS